MAGSRVSEARMHVVRWLLTCAWLLIIGSLFFDPFTARFTAPDHPWSPLRIPQTCVEVQGRCLVETPYPLGTTVFWGAVVPASIFLLLVFGHELWRRICPLSFLSQIPRALGLQRQTRKRHPKTGEVRRQLAKVSPDSWLAKHYPALQFGWLFAGLCGRLLFFNADRLVLAAWLLFTIAAAITVGWLYGGKAWCQYFCPMAPVQSIYSTPAGLLGSKAHQSPTPITQSMCRATTAKGEEQSACVACQQPCIDIDAERMYWARLPTPAFAFERYGYVGLVVGYFLYYYLYAGNWDYYFSGAWARQPNQLDLLLSPGLYLFGTPLNVPRLVAVPLVLGVCTWLGWLGGRAIEAAMRQRARRQGGEPDTTLIRHRVFLAATFLVFNLFFLFAGRPLLLLAPAWVQYAFDAALVATSTLWLARGWHRDPALYERENLAERFRRQLQKMGLEVGRLLQGRALRDLNPDEVYVLARVLPEFGSSQRHEAYKGVVREALAEGYVNVSSSLEVLGRMRRELGISDDEHRQLLEELGVEDPELLNPDRKRSLEDQVRLSGYRRSLERLLRLQGQLENAGDVAREAPAKAFASLGSLRRQYSITAGEEALTLEALAPGEGAARRAGVQLERLAALDDACRALKHPRLDQHPQLRALLADQLRQREDMSARAILEAIALLGDSPEGLELATRLGQSVPAVTRDLVAAEGWSERLPSGVRQALLPGEQPASRSELTVREVLERLRRLAGDPLATVAVSAVVLSATLDPDQGRALAEALQQEERPAWARQTAERLLSLQGPLTLSALPELEKRVVLATSDFFHRTWADTLDALADQADIRAYAAGALITEAGDTCRELLLLIEGAARVVRPTAPEGGAVERLRPGEVLDELEVLTHSASESSIVAEVAGTRVLAVPVDSFDAMLEHDPDFARRVLDLESRRLRRLTRETVGVPRS
ncbi:MAG: cyclic nucleotide-binding domain-containing protein [Cyanobacteriota bacterium]|nr:cyclic nucleotide-binding domain-containing protein [Cyanobacteriota bacterium]